MDRGRRSYQLKSKGLIINGSVSLRVRVTNQEVSGRKNRPSPSKMLTLNLTKHLVLDLSSLLLQLSKYSKEVTIILTVRCHTPKVQDLISSLTNASGRSPDWYNK